MQTLYRQQMQKEKAVRRSLRRDEQNSGIIESPDIDPENARLEQGRLDRERRVAKRERLGENEGSSTISGRQKNKPKYLNDYDQQNKYSDDDDDAFEEDEYDDEDENADESDEEEYIHGRSKYTKRGRGGSKVPRQRGGRSRSGRSSRVVQEPLKKQKQESMPHDNTGDNIELHGNLLLIYKRNSENRMQIDNLNIVLKGIWRLADDKDGSQDFIYKKTWGPTTVTNEFGQKTHSDEELLQEYFWQQDKQNEMIDADLGFQHKNVVNIQDQSLMLSKLFQSQG